MVILPTEGFIIKSSRSTTRYSWTFSPAGMILGKVYLQSFTVEIRSRIFSGSWTKKPAFLKTLGSSCLFIILNFSAPFLGNFNLFGDKLVKRFAKFSTIPVGGAYLIYYDISIPGNYIGRRQGLPIHRFRGLRQHFICRQGKAFAF